MAAHKHNLKLAILFINSIFRVCGSIRTMCVHHLLNRHVEHSCKWLLRNKHLWSAENQMLQTSWKVWFGQRRWKEQTKEGDCFGKDPDRRPPPLLPSSPLLSTAITLSPDPLWLDTLRLEHSYTHTTQVIHHRGDPPCCIVIGCQLGLVLRPVGLSIFASQRGPTQCQDVCCSASYQTHIYSRRHTHTFTFRRAICDTHGPALSHFTLILTSITISFIHRLSASYTFAPSAASFSLFF